MWADLRPCNSHMTDDYDGDAPIGDLPGDVGPWERPRSDRRWHSSPAGDAHHGRKDAQAENDATDTHSPEGDSLTYEDWVALPSDPDLEVDLGYRTRDWESFRTLDGSDQVMFLPEEEELLREDAFVVAADSVLCDLSDSC